MVVVKEKVEIETQIMRGQLFMFRKNVLTQMLSTHCSNVFDIELSYSECGEGVCTNFEGASVDPIEKLPENTVTILTCIEIDF